MSGATAQQSQRPNIIMIMADDVGITNVGAYSHGMMVPTPNIDRIAQEGMLFTDHYSEPTCTPGRASFITGQMPIRTGLTTVGLPGSPIGLDKRDPTLATVLKNLATAPASSARTISAIATSICRPSTASTSSSAISITLTPKTSPKTPIGRRTRLQRAVPAARRARLRRHRRHPDPPIRASAPGASSAAPIQAR